MALDGLHRGDVPMAADDLSGFIDETPLPGAPGSTLTYEQFHDILQQIPEDCLDAFNGACAFYQAQRDVDQPSA